MNKSLITIGTICALLWAWVTAMTFGISKPWCERVDHLTFGLFTEHVLKMQNGFYYDVSNNDMPTVVFLFIFFLIFVLVGWLILKLERTQTQKYSLGIIIFFAVLFRLILLPGVLIHENDIYRYIWDGKSSLTGINPYKYAPKDLSLYEQGRTGGYYDEDNDVFVRGKDFTDHDKTNLDVLLHQRDQNRVFYDRIGHWEVPTIYPPVVQLLFMIPVMMNGDSLVVMKVFFSLFDLGVLFLVIALLKHFGRNPCFSLIYGWSPLVLYEFANRGHYDAIPIFFTLLGLLLYVKRSRMVAFGVIALAALTKFFSGFLVPILWRPFKARYLMIFAGIMIVFYVPYFIWDQAGVGGVFQGLMTYNEEWSYNASVFKVIYLSLKSFMPGWADTYIPAKVIVGILYLIVLGFLSLRGSRDDLEVVRKCFWAIAILFIINPVADPWYYCWVMPFLCLFRYRSWYLLSGLLVLSYLNFQSEMPMVGMKFWGFSFIGGMIYVPFYGYWIWEILRGKLNASR